MGSIPGQGTKIPQATRCSQKKKKKEEQIEMGKVIPMNTARYYMLDVHSCLLGQIRIYYHGELSWGKEGNIAPRDLRFQREEHYSRS